MLDEDIRELFAALESEPRPEFLATLRRRVERECNGGHTRPDVDHGGEDEVVLQLDAVDRPPSRRRRGRRRRIAAIAASAAAIVTLTLVVRARTEVAPVDAPVERPAPTPPPSTPPPTSGAPQPTATAGGTEISTGGIAHGVVVAHGSVWVSSHGQSTVHRIDPLTNTVIAEIDLGAGFAACGQLHPTVDAVWVLACRDEPSARVDPATNQVVERTARGALPPVRGEDASTWQVRVFDQVVERIDPATGTALTSAPVGPLPGLPVAAFGAIWVPGNDGTITRVDTATGQASTVVLTTEETSLMPTVAAGSLWVADGLSGQVWRIGADGAVTVTSLRPTPPSSRWDINVAASDEHLFLRSGNEEVWEVDPATEQVVSVITVGGGGGLVTVGDGSLWIASNRDRVVHRIPLD